MNRRTLSLVATAVFVLVAATAATAASTNESVTPKLGFYENRASETTIKVVKIGNRRGAEFDIPIATTCTYGDGTEVDNGLSFGGLEETPIPIKDDKFTFHYTAHEPIDASFGNITTRGVVSGTFKSATKVVVKESVNASIDIQIPERPEEKYTCTGKKTVTAKHV